MVVESSTDVSTHGSEVPSTAPSNEEQDDSSFESATASASLSEGSDVPSGEATAFPEQGHQFVDVGPPVERPPLQGLQEGETVTPRRLVKTRAAAF